MARTNPEIDAHFSKAKRWRPELQRLREIVLDCGLTEERKWRQPCYTHDGGNVAIIGSFKEYVALAFFKGALLRDEKRLLVSPGKHSQSVRQFRFTAVEEIDRHESTIRKYLREAVAAEDAGLKVETTSTFEIPDELRDRFAEDPELKAAFEALTPGRQRAYAIHFSGAKQSRTRAARIEKWAPRILEGKGLNDR